MNTPIARQVTYVPKFGKAKQITTWIPMDQDIPPHRKLIEEILLYADPSTAEQASDVRNASLSAGRIFEIMKLVPDIGDQEPREFTIAREAAREASAITTSRAVAICDLMISTSPRKQYREAAEMIKGRLNRDVIKSATPADKGNAPVEVKEGMPVSQEPKYGIRDNRLYNRASGEFIPLDEPVFIFRARDKLAASSLEDYWLRCNNGEHQDAIRSRMMDFAKFRDAHPERMKMPDTDAKDQA